MLFAYGKLLELGRPDSNIENETNDIRLRAFMFILRETVSGGCTIQAYRKAYEESF